MKVIKSYITNNDCYKQYKKVNLKGLMIHSVGVPQPKGSVFIKQWNKPNVSVAVHGIIEPNGDVYQCLPYDMRGWHGGGSSNDNYLGFEMTEPSTIKYTRGSSFVDNNPTKTEEHVKGTYNTAVKLFASLCKEFGLNPLADSVIISHNEGYKRGIASNHGDVEHLWNKFGLTMKQFRQDINTAMNVSTPKPAISDTYTVKKDDTLWGIAQLHNITVDELKGLNGLKDDLIHVGDKLKISNDTHIVKKGDTLWSVAKLYNMTVSELKDLNGLKNNLIHVGDKLKLSKATKPPEKEKTASNSTPSKVSTTSNSTVLKNGSRGDEVKQLQSKLRLLGYNITADGIFGNATKNAVKDLQKNGRISADGIVGTNTYNLLNKIKTGKVTASFLNVRGGAGVNYRVVDGLKNGATVVIYEEKNGWYRISKNGWVNKKYIK